jgi:UDP-2,3-diacylglucosamine hydrolase
LIPIEFYFIGIVFYLQFILIKSHTYFISDLHLGTPDASSSRERELLFCKWLKEVSTNAKRIYIIGDLFDFWHEYKTVIPKGFVRAQAAIAQAVEAGVEVFLFTGNHDLWQNRYFEEELGVKVFFEPVMHNIDGKTFFIGHGDGLGPNDKGFKYIKKLFTNPVAQFFFRWLHPDIGMKIAAHFSYKSRFVNGQIPKEHFQGEAKEWLVQYCMYKSQQIPSINCFIFGHRHLPIEFKVNENCTYYNTGDWLSYYSYGVFDGSQFKMKTYST